MHFTTLYKSKINNKIYGISIILLILCNVNFTIENILEDKKNNIFINTWNKTLSWIPKNNLQKMYSFSQYFNEENILVYFIIIMCYIYYF